MSCISVSFYFNFHCESLRRPWALKVRSANGRRRRILRRRSRSIRRRIIRRSRKRRRRWRRRRIRRRR